MLFRSLLAETPATPPVEAPRAALPAPVTPADLVVVATSRTGNARAPSYDDGMIVSKTASAPVAIVVKE